MPDFTMTTVDPRTYLYVDRSCSMDPAEINAAMGRAFGDVMAFMEHHGIAPAGPPLSVYHSYDPDRMSFRAGVFVSENATRAAQDEIEADTTPGGEVLHFTHVGPYATLRDSYGDLMTHCDREGLTLGAPTWEVYVDDPETTPEHRLRTEVYVSLA